MVIFWYNKGETGGFGLRGFLEIADELEQRIVCGKLSVNDRLPGTREMAKDFSVTLLTMQRALTRLAERGLVRRVPRKGTYVSSSGRGVKIGLLMGGHAANLPSPVYMSYIKEFQEQAPAFGFTTREYLVFGEEKVYSSMTDLEKDSSSGELRCVIPVFFSDSVGRWLSQHPNIPFVKMVTSNSSKTAEEGVRHLFERGYTDILVLSIVINPDERECSRQIATRECEGLMSVCRELDVDTSRVNIVYGIDSERDAYMKTCEFIDRFRSKAENVRPAVLSLHDIYSRGVVMAMLERGVEIGVDMGLISHMNEGMEIFSPVKLSHIEIPVGEVVARTLSYIQDNIFTLKPGDNNPEEFVNARVIQGEST